MPEMSLRPGFRDEGLQIEACEAAEFQEENCLE